MMLGLLEQHNDRKVTGGNLDGLTFGELNEAQLKRAVRKYPTDATLRKFARAKLTLREIGVTEGPVPCAPLRIVPVVQPQENFNWKKKVLSTCKGVLLSWLANKFVCYGIFCNLPCLVVQATCFRIIGKIYSAGNSSSSEEKYQPYSAAFGGSD